jgi:putative addiction module component (TIGR02574 family)
MTVQELFAQAARLPSEERRVLAEIIWETVDADLPAQWENDSTITAEVVRRFEAFKAGRERGLSHDEVFAAAKKRSAFDLTPLQLGKVLKPLSAEDDLLEEMLRNARD